MATTRCAAYIGQRQNLAPTSAPAANEGVVAKRSPGRRAGDGIDGPSVENVLNNTTNIVRGGPKTVQPGNSNEAKLTLPT